MRLLLDHYNDGRRKRLFALAVNLLELEVLHQILERLSAEDSGQPLQRRAAVAAALCKGAAKRRGVDHYEKDEKGARNMEINAKSADRNLLLEFSGEIDHHGARDALRELELAVDAALPAKLVLDLAGVTFMDSSGIALILRAQQRMQLLDGSVLVCNVPPQARRVLDAAGVGRLVTIR